MSKNIIGWVGQVKRGQLSFLLEQLNASIKFNDFGTLHKATSGVIPNLNESVRRYPQRVVPRPTNSIPVHQRIRDVL